MSSFVLVSGDRTWPLESKTSRRLRIEAFNVLVLNDCLRGIADKELWSAKAFLKYISKEAGGWFDNVVFGELSVKWLRPCIGKYYEYNDDGFAYEVLDEKSPGAFEVWTIPYTSTGEATS